MAGFAGGQSVRLAANVVLTRLLFQEAFGLMALIAVFLQGLQLFSDIGITTAVVQNRHGGEPRFLRTAFTMQAVRGLLLWAAATAAALPVSRFYEDARLAWMIPIVATTVILQGLQSTKVLTASRELAVKATTLVELASQICGAAVMIGWALVHRSVAALVAGALATNLVKTALSHLLLPGERSRFGWDAAAAREMLRFGRWIFVTTIFTFLANQSDRLVFAKLVPFELFGVYGIAAMIAALPSQALAQLSMTVLFPLYSRIVARGEDLAAAFQRTRTPLLALGGWATSGLIAGGPTAIRLIYDDRYLEAGWMLQLLAVGVWFTFLENVSGAALLGRGKPKWALLATVLKCAAMVALIPMAYSRWGFPGAVGALAASELFRYLASVVGTTVERLHAWPRDLATTAYVFAVALVVRGIVRATGGSLPVVLEAALVAVAVSALWSPLGWRHLRALRAR